MPVAPTQIVPGVTFRNSVVACIRAQAERAPKILGKGATVSRHIAALNALADYVTGLDAEDQGLVALWQLARSWPDDRDISLDRFVPSERQGRLLHILGTSLPPPPTVAVWAELVTAAVIDFAEIERDNRGKLAGKLRKATEEVDRLERETADAAEIRDERDELRRQLDTAERKRADAEAKLDEFQRYAESGAFAEPDTTTPQAALNKARRERRKIEGEVGLYELTKASGETVIEVSFRDAEGTSRFRRLPAGTRIEQARETRERLSGAEIGDEDGEQDAILTEAETAAIEAGTADVPPDVGDDDTKEVTA